MDNVSFHSKKQLFLAAPNAGCRLLFLPPYSPEIKELRLLKILKFLVLVFIYEHPWGPEEGVRLPGAKVFRLLQLS